MIWSQKVEFYIARWGGVSGGKGDPLAKQAEAQQLNFNSELMTLFNNQYATQKDLLAYITANVKPFIEGEGQGMSNEALTAARTGSSDAVAQQTANAEQAFQTQNPQDRSLGSGVSAQVEGQILGAGASEQAKEQQQITLANEQLKNQNRFNALGILSGSVAPQVNPLGYAGSAEAGGNTVSGLSEANTAANQTGFFNQFGNAFFSGLGGALSGGRAGLKGLYGKG